MNYTVQNEKMYLVYNKEVVRVAGWFHVSVDESTPGDLYVVVVDPTGCMKQILQWEAQKSGRFFFDKDKADFFIRKNPTFGDGEVTQNG